MVNRSEIERRSTKNKTHRKSWVKDMGGICRSAGFTSVETSSCFSSTFSDSAVWGLSAFLREKKPRFGLSSMTVDFSSVLLGLESTMAGQTDGGKNEGVEEKALVVTTDFVGALLGCGLYVPPGPRANRRKHFYTKGPDRRSDKIAGLPCLLTTIFHAVEHAVPLAKPAPHSARATQNSLPRHSASHYYSDSYLGFCLTQS